ncbi:MAG TPA: AI-2E family transporter [Caulobacteraceae bacterium]
MAAPVLAVESGPPLTSLEGLSAVRAAVIFLAVVVAGVLVKIFQELLAPLVVAVFLTLLIDALSRDLDRRFPNTPRALRGAGAGAAIILGFTGITLLLVFQGPPFALQFAVMEPRLNTALAQVTAMVGQQPMTVHDLFRTADPGRFLGGIFAAARGAVQFAVLVMIFLGFIFASKRAFSAKLDRFYDTARHRSQAERVFVSIENAIENYVRLVTLKALLIAVVAFGFMTVMHINYAPFVAFLVFLSAFVPIVGAFAGALIPAMVALAQFGDVTPAAIVVGGLGGSVFLIDNVLMPKWQGDDLNIDPLLVLISLGFWGLLLGPTGGLLSTPLTVMVMAVAAEFNGTRWLAVLISKDGQPIKEIAAEA